MHSMTAQTINFQQSVYKPMFVRLSIFLGSSQFLPEVWKGMQSTKINMMEEPHIIQGVPRKGYR